jgi:transposase
MAYNFLRADRDQPFLLPPDLRDWLPAGHLAWFVLDVVDQLDLAAFYRAHRDDGHGHPAYDPKLLLGVLLYAYAIGVRSSRQIERRCREDGFARQPRRRLAHRGPPEIGRGDGHDGFMMP